jgi:hypothetical protein
MDVRAAVAYAPAKPLEVTTVQLDGPRTGEVLVEIKATGICHTDEFTLSGADPEGLFPAILGHEGAGIVVDIGSGVTAVKKGDHVIPLYTPECRSCPSCLSRKTNLCTAIRATQGAGVMPDGTSRFKCDGEDVLHYMGSSTFSNYIVVPEDDGEESLRVGARQGEFVGVADAGRLELDQHLPRPGTFEIDHLDRQRSLGFEGDGSANFHGILPRRRTYREAHPRALDSA